MSLLRRWSEWRYRVWVRRYRLRTVTAEAHRRHPGPGPSYVIAERQKTLDRRADVAKGIAEVLRGSLPVAKTVKLT